jgi:hypothetical protein
MGTGAGRVFLLALVLLFALQTTPASADKKAMHDAMMLPLLSTFCLLVMFFDMHTDTVLISTDLIYMPAAVVCDLLQCFPGLP